MNHHHNHTNILYFEREKSDTRIIDAVRQVIRKLTFETTYCNNLGVHVGRKNKTNRTITFIYRLEIISIQVQFHISYHFSTTQHYNHCLNKFNNLSKPSGGGGGGSVDQQLIVHQEDQRETLLFLEYKDCIQSIKCIQP